MATPPPPSAPKLPPGAKLPAKPPTSAQMPKLPAGMNIPRQTINVGAAMGAARTTSKAPAAPAGPSLGGVSNPNLKVTQGKIKKETMRISLPPKPGAAVGKPLSAFGGMKPPAPVAGSPAQSGAPTTAGPAAVMPKPASAVPAKKPAFSPPPPSPKPPSGPLPQLNVTRPLGVGASAPPKPPKPDFGFTAPPSSEKLPARPAVTETANIQAQEEPTAMIPGVSSGALPKPKAPGAQVVPVAPMGAVAKPLISPPKPAPPKPSTASATKPIPPSAAAPKPPVPMLAPKPPAPVAPMAPKVPLPQTNLESSSEDVRAKTSVIKPPPPQPMSVKPPAPAPPQGPSGKRATKALAPSAKGAAMPPLGGVPATPPSPAPSGPKPMAAGVKPQAPAMKSAPPSVDPGAGAGAPLGSAPSSGSSRSMAPVATGGGSDAAATGLAIAAGIVALIGAAVVWAGYLDML